ncbi:MAG TPA: cupredoxin domain-containing protein [Candidatus Acidoferrum sp.]|nr:cupredoxin domain-containing protein [Candidatus Acidoferrum sp.]
MNRSGVLALVGLLGMALLSVGCGRLFKDHLSEGKAPPEVQRVTFEIVARDNRCEPAVLAADRGGRSLLITFQVTSVGKSHVFQIPDLEIRTRIPADSQIAIPVVADRSGVYAYACNSVPWISPLMTSTGKLAIK